ncbi:centlein-like [Liolophura sinensis]|uniref:centlein-like n=1 Tax=Liolophura sinensis TaxID=3198878 RepID=UPI0031583CA0
MEVDLELERLRADNHALAEELQQCQVDKDFVWSLWRKLQVANPDITQAVSMVVQREKEKSELKDRKVLSILQLKDDKIEELHATVSSQARELQDARAKKLEQQSDVAVVRNDNQVLKEKLAALEDQTRSMKTREQNMDEYHRQVINELQSEKEVLLRQVSEQEKNLSAFETQSEELRSELKNVVTQKAALERQVKTLQKDITDKVGKFEELLKDVDNARRLVQKYETQLRQNALEIEGKNTELETVRHELSELWNSHHQLNEHATQQAELIRQLQNLQQDTQKMLKNQEDAYCIEATSLQQMYAELTTRFEVSKQAEADLRREMLSLKKQLFERDDTIVQLQHRLDMAQIDGRLQRDQQESFIHSDKENLESAKLQMESLMTENHLLKDNLQEKNRIIEGLESKLEQLFKLDIDHPDERSHSTPISRVYRSVALSPFRPRSRSASPLTAGTFRSSERRSASPSTRLSSSQDLQKTLSIAEGKVVELKALLKLKSEEVKELRHAHDKRLERLKSLQTSYRLAKEQLKTFEEDQEMKNKKKKLKKSHPRELQKENSDAVWNDLALYKKEAKTLQTHKMNLEEENDMLRVQTSQDAATIHELRMALEQEKEELEYQLQQRDMEKTEKYTSDVSGLQRELEDKSQRLDRCERELKQTADLQEKLLGERRVLRSELTELKQAASTYRIEIASLKREINRLEKTVERGKLLLRREAGASRGKRTRRPLSVRQPSKNVSSSTDKSSSMFEEADDDDWEEVTSETEETLTESDSLGRAIVSASRSLVTNSESADSAHRPTHFRLRSKIKQKKPVCRPAPSARVVRPSTRDVQCSTSDHCFRRKIYRDASTSPVAVFSSSPTKRSPTQRPLTKRKPMQQRVESLQQQLTAVRDSRSSALKTVRDLKETNEQLHTDLNLANQRLKMAKQNIQKLSEDLDRAVREKEDVECRLVGESTLSDSRRTEQEWKALESRLKSATFEVTRQGGLIRTLRTEAETATDQVKSLQDRVNRLERDNTQKRSLLEEQRSRLKQARDSVHNEATLISDLEAKVHQLTDANEKMKIQLESSKKRLTVILKEKKEYEERFFKATSELEKKNKQLSECQVRKADLESAMSDLESTAQHQLHGLASHSEAAIEAIQVQLKASHTKLQIFQKFVKTLVHEVCVRCQQARSLTKQYSQHLERHRLPVDRSLQKAQSVARDILNISQSDMDELMSVDIDRENIDTEIEDEKRRDKKWSKKCERLMMSQEDFVLPLVEMIMEKVDERQELISKLAS